MRKPAWLTAWLTACVATGLALASPALAQTGDTDRAETDDAEAWRFAASIYGWFPDLSGRTAFPGGPGGGTIDVPIGTILDNLEFTFQGAFAARKGRWGVIADVIYLDLKKSRSAADFVPPDPEAVEGMAPTGEVTLDMDSLILGAVGTYRIGQGEVRNMDLLFGVRHTDVGQDLSWRIDNDIEDPPIPAGTGLRSASQDLLDFVVGVRGRLGWSDDGGFFTPYYFDIGTGDSDLTWQGMLGVGYEFGWGDVVLSYRHLDYDLPSSGPVRTLEFGGPAVGAVFRF